MRNLITASIVATAILMAGAASAHPKLVASTPRNEAAVAAPTAIRLTFSERLVAKLANAELIMTGMPSMKMTPHKVGGLRIAVTQDGRSLVATPARPLSAGSYRLDYQVVAADTHRIKGSIAFRVM